MTMQRTTRTLATALLALVLGPFGIGFAGAISIAYAPLETGMHLPEGLAFSPVDTPRVTSSEHGNTWLPDGPRAPGPIPTAPGWFAIPILREHHDGTRSPAFYALHLPSLGVAPEALIAASMPVIPLLEVHEMADAEFSSLAMDADTAKALVDSLTAPDDPQDGGGQAEMATSDPVDIAVYYDKALMDASYAGLADAVWTDAVNLLRTDVGISINRVVLVQATASTPIPADISTWCEMAVAANYEDTVRSGVKGRVVSIFSRGTVTLDDWSTAHGLTRDGTISKRLSSGESRTGPNCVFRTYTPAFITQTYVDMDAYYTIPTVTEPDHTVSGYWTAHELGHVFGMDHYQAACWKDWYAPWHNHKTIEAATSEGDTPSDCGDFNDASSHYHWRYSASGRSHMQSEHSRWVNCVNAGWCTVAATPAAPSVSATRGNGQAQLSVAAAPPNGGSTITRYAIYRQTFSPFQAETPIGYLSGSTGTYTDQGLTNAQTYHYYLRAENLWGLGPRSAYVSVTPAASAPAAPTLNSATGGSTYVDLAWTAGYDGGSPITSYKVYRGTCSGCMTLIAPSVTGATYRDTAVSAGTTYYYKVSAVNSVGSSALSNERSAIPTGGPSVPGAPTLNSATGGSVYVDLAWTAGSNGGSAITSYTLYRGTCSGCESFYVSGIASTSYRDTGVSAGTTYFYKVAAVNSVGTGPQSNERSATPTAPAGPANDNIANAFVGSGTSWTPASQNAAGATSQTNEIFPCGMGPTTVWYRFTPSSAGTYRFSTAGSNYDTVVAVYGSAMLGTTQMGCNDDFGGLQSQLDLSLGSGTAYWVQVGGYSSTAPGTLQLSIALQGGGGGTVYVRDDDGTREGTLDVDHGDDTAIKSLNVRDVDHAGAVSARLWVYAEGENCGATGGTHSLYMNGNLLLTYDPCTRWSMGAYSWSSFTVPVGSILHDSDGVLNDFAISDSGATWTDQGAFFGVDTSNDDGRSYMSANGGADMFGELMWYLEITK